MRTAICIVTATLLVVGCAAHASADPLDCNLTAYRPLVGLQAEVSDDVLTLTWAGDPPGWRVRLRLAIDNRTPVIRELAVYGMAHAAGKPVLESDWTVVVANVFPEFRLAAGLRRISNQQLQPLRGLKVELTPEVIDRYKWDAFWDAPLDLDQSEPRAGGNPPP